MILSPNPRTYIHGLRSVSFLIPALLIAACSSDSGGGAEGSSGGAAQGGSGNGGSGQGGSSQGGSQANGGSSQGGSQANGGSSVGGSSASGGASANGGSGAGASGGSGTGGAAMCDTPLTQWEQKMLDDHNKWRASVDPAAANMYRVHWDTEIAKNAAAWVKSCDPDWPHSPEETRSNVGGYEVLGENLSYCGGTGCSEDPRVTDGSGLGDGDGWWDERNDYNWADDSSNGVTSHYTQMVSSNVYAMGCATQKCASPGPFGWDGEWWWTICQYGPRGQGYWVGTKPYEAGSGGLIEPPDSVYDEHPGLCR